MYFSLQILSNLSKRKDRVLKYMKTFEQHKLKTNKYTYKKTKLSLFIQFIGLNLFEFLNILSIPSLNDKYPKTSHQTQSS